MLEPNQPSPSEAAPRHAAHWRERWHEIIFETDTAEGKTFDVLLLVAIAASVGAVALESMEPVRDRWGGVLRGAEWAFTIFFSIEYVMRLLVVRRPLAYARSFFGVIDLLAVLPTYLSLFFTGAQALLVIRAFRLLRVFRIFKVARYVSEISAMANAFRKTRAKIAVFLFVVLCAVLIIGTAMYVIEGAEAGFDSIPRSVYWAIVTMTTVGYGDIAPETAFGQLVAAIAMMLGYALIIIPTGVFAVELVEATRQPTSRHCTHCARSGHDLDAKYCKHCGELL